MSILKNNGDERRGRRMRLMAISALAVAASAVVAGPQLASATPAPPEVPGNISVPAGNVLFDVGRAQGFQIYTCQPQSTGPGWVLQQPMAVLLEEGHKPFALHYGGPSWTAMDGSTIVGTKVDGAPAPTPTAIPWLLLSATPKSGPTGTLTPTTFIQRLNTTGGLAPTSGCDADHIGTTAPVAYTADYYFFRAA